MEVQEFEREHEQKKMNNKLLSQITFTNKEKEKISYLNYLPPTIDESSSDMSCKFISCLMFVRVRILCSVIIIASVLAFFFNQSVFFLVEELVFLMASEKCCKTPKLMISNNILFKCLECRRYFTNAWKSICHVRRKFIRNNYAHLFI